MAINTITLSGRFVRETELRYTSSGVAVASNVIAVDRPFTNANGEREADFIDLVFWRGLAENVANNTFKGQKVSINGRLESRVYEDSEGKNRYVKEVNVDNIDFHQWRENDQDQEQEQTQTKKQPPKKNTRSRR